MVALVALLDVTLVLLLMLLSKTKMTFFASFLLKLTRQYQ